MVAVFLAEGFEELEALTPVDVLRRAGIRVCTAGVGGRTVTGAHGIPVVCDITAQEVDLEALEMVVLPGGMPGAANLDASGDVDRALAHAVRRDLWIAAICAAPLVLGRRGLARGKRVTCYPGFEGELTGGIYTAAQVEQDGKIITANGPGAALPFAFCLASILKGENEAAALAEGMQWQP